MFSFLHGHGAGPSGLLSIALICSFSPWPWKPVSPSRFSKHSVEIPHKAGVFQRYLYHSHSSLESARSLYSINSINSINSTQLNSIQFNSIQFNSIQFNSINISRYTKIPFGIPPRKKHPSAQLPHKPLTPQSFSSIRTHPHPHPQSTPSISPQSLPLPPFHPKTFSYNADAQSTHVSFSTPISISTSNSISTNSHPTYNSRSSAPQKTPLWFQEKWRRLFFVRTQPPPLPPTHTHHSNSNRSKAGKKECQYDSCLRCQMRIFMLGFSHVERGVLVLGSRLWRR